MNTEGVREMTTKHTPGPWSVSKYGDDYNITFNDAGNWLATVYYDDDPVAGRPEADARMIAAAPDLLEALRDCLGRFIEAFPASAEYEPIKRGFAAIAKAEGRS